MPFAAILAQVTPWVETVCVFVFSACSSASILSRRASTPWGLVLTRAAYGTRAITLQSSFIHRAFLPSSFLRPSLILIKSALIDYHVAFLCSFWFSSSVLSCYPCPGDASLSRMSPARVTLAARG